MLSTAKLDSLFSVIVDRKYLIPSVYLGPNASRFCAVPFKWNRRQSYFQARARVGGGVTRLASCAAFTCTRTLGIFSHKCPMSHNFSFKTKLPTGVARLFFRVAVATPCHPGRSAPAYWIVFVLFLSKNRGMIAHIWDFKGLLFWNSTSDCPDSLWVTRWGVLLSPWSEISIWLTSNDSLIMDSFH